MLKGYDDIPRVGKDNMDGAMRSLNVMSSGFQSIATEIADYSRKTLEDQAAVMKELIGARSPEKALEIQSAYVRSACESFVARATKIGQLYSDLAKECWRPWEGAVGGRTPAK